MSYATPLSWHRERSGDMFVATNRIKIKKGFGEQLEELFRSRGEVAKEPGFVDFELWRQDDTDDHEE
jgi:heme oxygenase (staphylobilin-producing)